MTIFQRLILTIKMNWILIVVITLMAIGSAYTGYVFGGIPSE